MGTPATTTPAVATSFDSRIQFAPLYAELHTKGIDFNEAERTQFEEILHRRAREFNGGSLFGGEANGIIMHLVNMFVYALESLRQNFSGVTTASFTDWMKSRGQETSAFGENKATLDMANYIFRDLYNAGGKLRQTATLVSGVAMDGHVPTANEVATNYNVITQLTRTSTERGSLVNPTSVSLNLNTADANPAVVPYSGLPRQTRALTNTVA